MKSYTYLAIVLAALLFASCGTGQKAMNGDPVNVAEQPAEAAQEVAKDDCKICDVDVSSYTGPLSKDEIQALLLALDDEYKAWATYDGINKAFGDPRPFVNIQRAEGRHIERLKALFSTYELETPENPWTKVAPKFESLADACKAGVDAEIANRNLYDKLLKSTEREDIVSAYRALQSASENNHLPAFERCVSRAS